MMHLDHLLRKMKEKNDSFSENHEIKSLELREYRDSNWHWPIAFTLPSSPSRRQKKTGGSTDRQ